MNTIGIRREDKSNWERRVPITPGAVARLTAAGVRTLVEPSEKRVFTAEEYAATGAEITPDLSPCNLVFGVKEIPEDRFREGVAYVFFSHTIKGQDYNMAMLRRMVERKVHLIDYEKIVDARGRRLVLFGRFAGLAGMIDSLHFYGRRLALEGHETPLNRLQPAHRYPSLTEARAAVAEVGNALQAADGGNLPEPLVCGFAGYGNVSGGAQEIFDLLQPETVAPGALAAHRPEAACVKVVFHEEDMVRPREPGKDFALQDYYDRPEGYESQFERYLPHLTLLINAIYWEARYPRLVTRAALRSAWERGERNLRVIGDISADIEGAVEPYVRAADPGDPTYVYHPLTGGTTDGVEGEGILIEAVDILPCELPREASEAFSSALGPFLLPLAEANFAAPLDRLALPEAIRAALILKDGEFTPPYRAMEAYLSRP